MHERLSDQERRWHVWVDVVGARNLESRQALDSYCIVRSSVDHVQSHAQSWRSVTVSSTTQPLWGLQLDIPTNSCVPERLVIEIFNEKNFFFDMFPGTVRPSEDSPRDSLLPRGPGSEEGPDPDGNMSTCETSDEALGVAELDLAFLQRRAERGVHATDRWYLLHGAKTGEVRVRTVIWMEDDNGDIEPLCVLEDQVYTRCEAQDHYGFRVAPHALREWAHLRSYEDCREQRRVSAWEAAFGSQFFSVLQSRTESTIVKRLARDGIPRHWRQRVYMVMSGARDKQDKAAPAQSYATLVSQIDARDSTSFRQIELDIDRTFGHSGTTICTESGRAALRRVLKAYSMRNPKVGYCQGLNFLVGFFMLVLDEESAFWLLAVVCEDLFPGYYIPTMADTQTDMLVLKQLIAEELPRLDEFTANVGLPLELLGSQWLLCLFTTTFPAETVFRIFDCIMTEGSSFVFAVIMAHLRRLEPHLLGLDDFQTVLSTMKDSENALVDADEFIRLAVRETARVTPHRIALRREEYSLSVQDEMQRADRARALNRQLAVVYQIPAFSSSAARLLRFFHEEAEVSSRADVAFLLTLLCHGLVWLAEHSKHLRR